MNDQPAPDSLDLAEAVARGQLSAAEAEAQLRRIYGTERQGDAEQAVRELKQLRSALTAVTRHARAVREATVAEASSLAASSSTASPAPTPIVQAGPVHARPARHEAGGARPDRSRRTGLLVAATVLVGGAILGATIATGGFRATQPPTATPLAATSADATTSATDRPTVASTSEPAILTGSPAQPGMFGRGFSSKLVSDSVGWVTNESGLYRTEDMGATWTHSIPPGWATGGAIAIVDSQTAVMSSATNDGGQGPHKVATTHDGGVSWTEATLDVPAGGVGPWVLTFRDASRGYATFGMSETSPNLLVFATADGGATWTGPTHGTTAVLTRDLNKLEGGEDGVLWLSDGKADNVPFDDRLAWSTDGGATWTKTTFPTDATAPAGVLKWPVAAWADDNGHVILAISVASDTEDTEAIYDSRDAGRTWRLVRSMAHQADLPVHFLSETTWVVATDQPARPGALAGSEIWSTIDGGDHWRHTVARSSVDHVGGTFGSPDSGWAVRLLCVDPAQTYSRLQFPKCGGSGVREQLVGTRDGGITWTVLVP